LLLDNFVKEKVDYGSFGKIPVSINHDSIYNVKRWKYNLYTGSNKIFRYSFILILILSAVIKVVEEKQKIIKCEYIRVNKTPETSYVINEKVLLENRKFIFVRYDTDYTVYDMNRKDEVKPDNISSIVTQAIAYPDFKGFKNLKVHYNLYTEKITGQKREIIVEKEKFNPKNIELNYWRMGAIMEFWNKWNQ
jgi:hypothetical protein